MSILLDTELTERQQEIILGGTLGDMYIGVRSSTIQEEVGLVL